MPPAIRTESLGKRYQLGNRGNDYTTLRESIVGAATMPLRTVQRWRSGIKRPSRPSVWALRNVNLEIAHGDVVGIIGRNGAGKSTLLKILSRITEPTEGFAELSGRVRSLLEVGTGFHPELTGRENIYLNGAILGMRRREIDRHFDAIVAFAGVEPFLDTLIKHYSSGMHLRLGFAVAAHLQTEILLVDEVLAVGDAEFQQKCLGKMSEVSREGRTVLFVSHNLGAISQLCRTAVLLEKGEMVCTGEAPDVVRRYLTSVTLDTSYKRSFPIVEAPVQILDIHTADRSGSPSGRFDIADDIRMRVSYVVRERVRGVNLCAILHREGLDMLCSFDTDHDPDLLIERVPGTYVYEIVLPKRLLKAGLYSASIGCGYVNRQALELHRDAIGFRVEALSEDTTMRGYNEGRPGMLLGPVEWRNADSLERPRATS
jgi:lipopolysaccharide transport system ATP-binding protein